MLLLYQPLSFSIWVGFKRICRRSFLFFRSSFSRDDLVEPLLLLLELLRLVEQCLFLFLDLGLVVGICLARLWTDFARVAIDLLCFLYSLSSLKTLSEVSIFAVLLILLLDCSGWETGRVCELPRLGVIWLLWLFSWLYILLYYILYVLLYIYIYINIYIVIISLSSASLSSKILI